MSASAPNALDVRPLEPPRKSTTVLATFDRLDRGESFILVDDQDPMSMRSSLEEKHPGEAQWRYLRDGPYVWHVRIRRRAAGQ
ncbi:hypothetical protein BSZ35_11475 [Salinibacter sp. 10B]|uniref:DUF2249 domain-containing protein n=1 Tax=Salinibacter sp. 10B TaxID=1923971 RepID=UPI000CF384FF|nr:DUF2249 domain-containing protein [Salinibacter sp. 10B]PQJ35131.1 hypothetical protein BSZ35_11475 [Salinibacter sp. 10B]